jgi:hypothetical protein
MSQNHESLEPRPCILPTKPLRPTATRAGRNLALALVALLIIWLAP